MLCTTPELHTQYVHISYKHVNKTPTNTSKYNNNTELTNISHAEQLQIEREETIEYNDSLNE